MQLPDFKKLNIFEDQKIALTILTLIGLFLFLFKIGSIPILDGDTAFYAKIAKNIITSGNWLTLTYSGSGEIINKPPLMMWLTAISYKLFGINEFALSFWHSIIALGTVLITYFIAKELFDKKTAFISSLILLTSFQFFYQARSPLQDMPLTFFITASFLTFILYFKRKNLVYFYLTPIFVALAVLTKGPIGLVIPSLIFLGVIAFAKEPLFKKLSDYFIHLLSAIILFAIITLPWFIAEYFVLGNKFVNVFWSSNIGRFLTPIDKVPGAKALMPQFDFYSYPLQLLLLFIPWSGFLYPAIYQAFRKKGFKMNAILIFGAATLLFFSFSLNYKVSRYILPAYPALAIIVAVLWNDRLSNKAEAEKPMFVSNMITLLLIIPLLALLIFWLIMKFPAEQIGYQPIVLPFLAIFIIGMIFSSIILFSKKVKLSFICFTLSGIISCTVLITLTDIYFKDANPTRAFCNEINSLAAKSDLIGKYRGYDAHLMSYYCEYSVQELKSDEKLLLFLKQKKKAYLLTDDKQALSKFILKHPGLVKLLEEKNNYILFTN